ncbi:MAG TPA: hypothetical protein VGC41_20115 [Kofleriaceae bacterium]
MTNKATRETLEHVHGKVGRELLQAERSCRVHARREAKRQGAGAPADAMLALAQHADRCESQLEALLGLPRRGVLAARVAAYAFTNVRHGLTDRFIAHERTYRVTLLGIRHGLDAARLLSSIADREDMPDLATYLENLVAERTRLFESAVAALEWFADFPDRAAAHS